jgi:2,4-diketo-3-deoxy-L-fuconate hydrolase
VTDLDHRAVPGDRGSGTFALATFAEGGGPPGVGLVVDGALLRLDGAQDAWASSGRHTPAPFAPGSDLVRLLDGWDRTFAYLEDLVGFVHEATVTDERVRAAAVGPGTARLLPPLLRPSKILCAAQNYPDHVAEMRRARTEQGFNATPIDESRDFTGDKSTTRPYLFLKAPSSLTGPTDDIELPEGCASVDWEVELAVVIGRRAKRIAAERALDHVAGYMVINDVSCRDLLFRPDRERLRSDWLACKSHDGFAPTGPVFVPRQFVPDHLDLGLRLRVNGETKQDGNTGHLIYTPDEQIEYASNLMTLMPGDIFATGTPGGVGQGSGQFLAPGDVVEAEVDGIGCLRNRFVEHLDDHRQGERP